MIMKTLNSDRFLADRQRNGRCVVEGCGGVENYIGTACQQLLDVTARGLLELQLGQCGGVLVRHGRLTRHGVCCQRTEQRRLANLFI